MHAGILDEPTGTPWAVGSFAQFASRILEKQQPHGGTYTWWVSGACGCGLSPLDPYLWLGLRVHLPLAPKNLFI